MLTDVHSFSVVGTEMGAAFPAFVQAYFERMGEEITSRGGLIVKYIGDTLLALFDAGREEQAVDCAVAMRRAYNGLATEHHLATETELEVGIASGEILVGTFGHPTLVVRDVMGEAVYEAGRLMHHRGVAVTGTVREALLGGRHVFRHLADIAVKWNPAPLQAWELVESLP
jgi:class 3 adenylate cyclase